MKHRNSDMIIAKAENTELVVFIKYVDGWKEASFLDLITLDNPFFLCLPQHNKDGQCLHWLNGSEVEWLESEGWVKLTPYRDDLSWSSRMILMQSHESTRIKPRKEKRWIAVCGKYSLCEKLFTTKDDAEEFVVAFHPNNKLSDWQIIEIEVEV